jgi:signal transduction histidine kinase
MSTAPALALELSCRYLAPLLDIVEQEKWVDDMTQFLAPWTVDFATLRERENWVSLRFSEALVDWMAARLGPDELATRVTRTVYSPAALGYLYPLLRAFGSPRAGYSRLPQLVPMMNKVSDVRTSYVRRGAAAIEYRPAAPQYRERSPLVCRLRKEQLAAGPTIWALPPAQVDETACQANGAESCRYELKWVERAPWRGTLVGIIGGLLASVVLPHGWSVLLTLIAGGALGRMWDLRVHTRELEAFVREQREGLRAALEVLERRFVELEEAKAAVDAKVEQRTIELRIATEKRVHTEKLAILGTLAAGLAHEVRNPANAIVTGLRPVKRHLVSLGADSDQIEMVDIAIDAGEQISKLVSDLLDAGRTDRGLEPWDPHQGIETAIRLLSHGTSGLQFVRDFAFVGKIIGRPPALNQIFLNLLDNAIRAAGDKGTVQIVSRAEAGGVAITIADNGPGIDPEVAPLIFDPFLTTRAVGQGTGLGLHFSRQVAYDHGGTLDLVVASGAGACFRLWLPAQPPENPMP